MVGIRDIDNHQYVRALDEYSIVAATDKKGINTYVNSKFTEISGYSKEELIGAPASIVNSGYHDKAFFMDLWKTIVKGNNWFGEICNRKKSGEIYWVYTGIFPLKDSKGDIQGFFSIRTDITDQKKVQKELRDSKNKLKSFFESTADANVLLDANYKILAFNRTAQTYISNLLDAQLQIGKDLLAMNIPGLGINFKNNFRRALQGAIVNERRHQDFPKRGRIYWDYHYRPALDDEGNTIGVTFSAIDVTQHKQYELELKNRARLLEDISLRQSHQVRGPLATMLGLIYIREQEEDEVLKEEYYHEMVKKAYEMDEMIKQIVEQTYQLDEIENQDLRFRP
ncbi:MAG: PAS domain-containing protein [Cyclobacteriaceae bacterium]|nr:PAS domain S-box protein [Cyclobacteriaceae bacterium]MCH8517285.1 PAS domain-containing protein [Cyclobacteriaceae bacterium]